MPLTTLNDQLNPEAIPRSHKFQSIAQFSLLAILFLEWPRHLGCFVFGSLELVGIVFAVLLIWGIQARQWILVGVAVGIVGFNTLISSGTGRGNLNESAAVANLRTINTAEVTYLSSSGGNFGDLPALVAAGLLDDTFIGTAMHPKAGYIYNITATGSDYTATADPASAKTGRYGYYTVPDAVVRYSTNASLAPRGQAGRWVQ